jgi:localization factor PodJL
MTSGTPWSVKGIDPKAREVAKDLARRSGMTLGEWLNRMILEDEGPAPAAGAANLQDDDGPEEITSQAYFEQRPPYEARGSRPAYYETPRPERHSEPAYAPAIERLGRFEAPQHPGDEIGRVAMALDRLTQRIEQSEGRTGLAITGVEQSVRDAISRIEAAEREHIAVAARFDGALETAQTEHERLAERLRRMEKDAAGPRSVEALQALEVALGKVANHLYEGENRTREHIRALEERVEEAENREGEAADPAALIEDVIAKVSARLSDAEGRTAEALQGLGAAFASLDDRLRSVESGDGRSPALEERLEALAAELTAKVEASRAEIAEKIQASAEGRFDRMERTIGEMAEHVRQAEQTSAQAIERMGQEVLTIADTLNRRVQAAENRSAEAIEQVGGEMARIAQAVETRLGRADSVHAEALERLGGEIARITERLAERMGAAERRSAQAIDDVGEQVARVTERIQQRQDRASEELSERIRQSEERTARLLSEARDTIDRGLAENQRRLAEQLAPQRLVREEPADDFQQDPFPGFGPPEPAPEKAPARPQAAATRRDLGPFLAEIERPNFEAADFDAADDFVRIEEEPTTEAAPEPDIGEAPVEAAGEPEPAAAEMILEPEAPSNAPDPFAPQALAPEIPEPAAEAASPDEIEAEVEEIEDAAPFARQATAAPERPLSTREVIEQARAAARAATTNGDHKKAKAKAEKPAKVSKLSRPIAEKTSGFSLFSSFGQKPKRRAGTTLQTALLITGGAAFLSLGAAGMIIAAGEPGGKTPKRVADALDAARGGEIKTAEADTTPFGDNPRVSVALAPQPLSTQPKADAATAEDLDALYREGTRAVEANQPEGVELLRRAANLGHSPSQFYLSKLYEEGRGGLPKDPAEARRWTERAAENGNRQAMHNLGIAYVDGKGGPKNSALAAQWFRRAADLGLVDSQYNLAALHEQGLGVAKNAAEAYKWYLIAAKTGDEEARAAAARVRAQLTPEARVVAERAAAAFSSPMAPAPGALASSSGGSVAMAQRALSRLRYYNGPTDGISSPALRGAIAQYQRDQGLKATGALDQTTVARLSVFTR